MTERDENESTPERVTFARTPTTTFGPTKGHRMVTLSVRGFVEDALARATSGDRLAKSMEGPVKRAYAKGVNDGIKEALTQVRDFIDQGNRSD